MDFYLIHSIKGGCGKTSVALMLASQLAVKDRRVCLLDMDFKGTGLGYLLLGNSNYDGIEQPDDFSFWNECFADPTVDFAERMLVWAEDPQKKARFHIAISDPKQQERDKFIASTSPTDGLAVNTAIFRFKFLEIVKKLEDLGYTDVVLDLPPSFDEYTKGIFQEFFSKDSREGRFLRDNGNRMMLYMVTSYDRAHFRSTIDYLTDYYKRSRHRHRPADVVKVIFNDVSGVAARNTEEELNRLFDSAYSGLLVNSADSLIKVEWKEKLVRQNSILEERAKKENLIELYATEGDPGAGPFVGFDYLIAK